MRIYRNGIGLVAVNHKLNKGGEMMEYKIGERYEVVEIVDKSIPTSWVKVGDIAIIYGKRLCTVKDGNNPGAGCHNIAWYKLKKLEEIMFKVGDIIVNTDGDESKILAVIENCFLRSAWDVFDHAGSWYIFKQAEQYGWKLKPTTTKLSMGQIADKFGINVDNLEIMKEE